MAEQTNTKPTIAIIGAGIAGSALALLLKRAGIPCEVFEASPGDTPAGAGLQIAPNGMKVLSLLGLDEDLRKEGATSVSMRFTNQKGRFLSELVDKDEENKNHRAVNSLRATVHHLIVEKARAEGVPIHFNRRLIEIVNPENDPVCKFEDGSSFECNAVIGADGIWSKVRTTVVPEGLTPEYTGLLTLGGFISASKLQKPPPADSLEMYFGPVGFFGYGFCNGDHSRLMWWNAIPGDEVPRSQLQSMTDDEKKELCRKIHAGWCDPIGTIIEETDPNIFVGNIYDIQSLPRWSRGRVCLIGDAAHAVSPHSGQGASMALEDAAYLAACLERHPPEKAFQLFEQGRRKRAEEVVQMGRRSGNQKRPLGPIGAWFRDQFVAYLLPTFAGKFNQHIYRYDVKQEIVRTLGSKA